MNKKDNKEPKFNKNKAIIASSLALFSFISMVSDSHMASFFPIETEKKNIKNSMTSLVFAVHPLVIVLASPLIGIWIPTSGVRFTLIAGTFLEGGSAILFGFVAEMPEQTTFLAYSFVIRSVIAFGNAMSQTAALAIISVMFKENLTSVFGALELFSGVGYMIGPAISGGLYQLGGFRLPFFVIGGSTLTVMLLMCLILPSNISQGDKDDFLEQKNISIFRVLRVPGVLVIAFVTIFTQIVFSFIDPTLAYHLEDVTNNGLSTSQIGLCFLLWSVLYTVLTPLIGFYADKKFRGRYGIIFGDFLLVIGCFMAGPADFLSGIFPKKLYIVLIGLLLTGAGSALIYVPSLADMRYSVIGAGMSDSLVLASLISGIFNSCFSVGNVVGPVISSLLTGRNSFANVLMTAAFILTFLGVFLALFTVWENSIRSKIKDSIDLSEVDNGTEVADMT